MLSKENVEFVSFVNEKESHSIIEIEKVKLLPPKVNKSYYKEERKDSYNLT